MPAPEPQRIKLDPDKLKIVCNAKDISLRKLAFEMDINWGQFSHYLYNNVGVPADVFQDLCARLDVGMHTLQKQAEFDLKTSALRRLAEIDVLVDAGEMKINDFFRNWNIVAQYFLVKPKDSIDMKEMKKESDALKTMLQDIMNAVGDDDDVKAIPPPEEEHEDD